MARWIKPNINIDFVGRRKTFWTLSTLLILGSIGMLVANFLMRGDALNYSTDFKGGSEIQIEFSRKVGPAAIRAALTKGGFKGAEVVRVSDEKRPHFFMLRLTEVSAFSEADQKKVKSGLESKYGKKNLTRFDYKSGGDKVYVNFKRGYKTSDKTAGEIEAIFKQGKIDVQQVQRFGRAEDNVFEVALLGLDRDIRKIFDASLGKGIVKDVPQVESVGAKMGKQLRDDGIKSVIYALLLMLVYIAFRFDFQYAPGAVVALAHDVLITTGLFAVAWQEFSLSVVAALLTIAGYSINDTIVVYDRIRENVAKMRDRKFPMVVNASINETLSRTLLTSLTTLFTCVSIWVVGTGVLKTFAFALTAGVLIGTYSSIFIASPITIVLNEKFAKKKKAR
jgi:preprotein translocase subunit SecF